MVMAMSIHLPIMGTRGRRTMLYVLGLLFRISVSHLPANTWPLAAATTYRLGVVAMAISRSHPTME